MADTTSDVVDVILAQHQRVKGLLSEIANSAGGPVDDTFCELRRAIAVHETAEEEVIYPALRVSGVDGQRVAEERTAEEREGTEALGKLEDLEPGSPEFMTLFTTFRKDVLHHAELEEATVLPLLRTTQSMDNRRKMASAFELAEKTAPTHAHPHSGTSAVSNIVTGPALAIMDRVRDALRKN